MNTSTLSNGMENINKLGFNDIWNGSAYETHSTSLSELMAKLSNVITQIDNFNGTLEKREKYIEICESIIDNINCRNACDISTIKGMSLYNYYQGNINNLEIKRKKLREEILSELSQYVGINAEISSMTNIEFDGNLKIEPGEDIGKLKLNMPKSVENSTLTITNPDYDGLLLTPEQGRKFNGPQAVETYYDLNMDNVVRRMETEYGIKIEAWIDEETGLKMCRKEGEDKEYVMVAAYAHSVWYGNDIKPNAVYNMGDEVLTSWGEGLIVDYCKEAEIWYNAGKPTRFDIATAWTPTPDCNHRSYYAEGSAYAKAANEEYKKNHPEIEG